MTTIFQTIFSFAFSWMVMHGFRLKLVPKGLVNNIPALAPIMAWRRPGAKPLSEPKFVILPTHIFVTRPQWVNEMDIIFHFPAYRSQGPTMHHTIDCDVISRNKAMYALLWRPLYALTWLLFWYIYHGITISFVYSMNTLQCVTTIIYTGLWQKVKEWGYHSIYWEVFRIIDENTCTKFFSWSLCTNLRRWNYVEASDDNQVKLLW